MAWIQRTATAALLVCGVFAAAAWVSGCMAAKLIGGMGQADEDQKLLDVPPKYRGLEDKTIAVIVTTDMSTQFEFPHVQLEIGKGVSQRIAQFVPGAKVMNPDAIVSWMFRTPHWDSLPYSELTEQLNVDRIVFVDVLEYRLNPPGNRYVWEGVCLGRVGVIERGGLDADTFVETFDINTKFPSQEGVTRDDATQRTIEGGLLYDFVQRTVWQFHQHLEPKHPDRYRPELDSSK